MPNIELTVTEDSPIELNVLGDTPVLLGVQEQINETYSTPSPELKQALLQLAEHIAYIDDDGQTYYDALYEALYPTASVVSISAEYTQSGTVWTFDTLNDLKDDLVVTALYSDGTSEEVTTYTLSGSLTAGTSTITVTFMDKTDTFDVVVSEYVPTGYTKYDYLTVPTTKNSMALASWIILKKYDDLNAVSVEFVYKPLSGHGDGNAIFGRRSASGYGSSFAFYNHTAALGWHLHGSEASSAALRPTTVEQALNVIKYHNTASSPSSLTANDSSTVSIQWGNTNVLNLAPALFSNPINDGNINIVKGAALGYIKFFDLSGNLLSWYVPVVRDADNVIGMYEVVEQTFYSSATASYATIGNTNCMYSAGNW